MAQQTQEETHLDADSGCSDGRALVATNAFGLPSSSSTTAPTTSEFEETNPDGMCNRQAMLGA